MLAYSWPIVILGIAGILNQVADKILFPYIYEGADAKMQLGIYGACAKIAMIMAMITQAFRYAYEPFVFGAGKGKESKESQALVMKYFVMFTLLAFLAVVANMGLLRHIINPQYWEGLNVVPIVMMAEIFMGIYFNLSFWYKITDKTIWGAVFSGIGCVVLLAVNIIFVPRYGYIACAWGGFAGYATAMVISYFVGQKYYPLDYPLKEIAVYLLLAFACFEGMRYFAHFPLWGSLGINTLLILLFVGYILWRDFPLGKLPVVGKYFRKNK
jgi:O-antigen/teichoic acid export membrane protein